MYCEDKFPHLVLLFVIINKKLVKKHHIHDIIFKCEWFVKNLLKIME